MEKNYIYRLVFKYPSTPNKIDLPFVEYAPKQITFSFVRDLNDEEKDKFINIANELDSSKTGRVKYQLQKKYLDNWVTELDTQDLSKAIKYKYGIDIAIEPDSKILEVGESYSTTSSQKEDWRMFLQGYEARHPGMEFIVNQGILKPGKYLLV